MRTGPDRSVREHYAQRINKDGIKAFHDFLKFVLQTPSRFAAYDPVFVALDFEFSRRSRIPKELGVARLDTRLLFDSQHSPECVIESRHFHFASDAGSDMCQSFRFGSSEVLGPTKQNFEQVLQQLLQIHNHRTGKPRNIVLVGHNVYSEIYIMAANGVHLGHHAPVVSIMDTHQIGKQGLKGESLETLLRRLDVQSTAAFHNAGNDATLTLHALLLLACHVGQKLVLTLDQKARLSRLKAVCSLPVQKVQLDLRAGQTKPRYAQPAIQYIAKEVALPCAYSAPDGINTCSYTRLEEPRWT